MNKNNPYIDINYIDRSEEVDKAFLPTLKDIKNDPEFYAELVNDLMFHWIHGTRETAIMITAKRNMLMNKNAQDTEIPDNDSYDYDNGYTHSQQSYSDRSDYARELYERGKIDHIQMAEMRVGA